MACGVIAQTRPNMCQCFHHVIFDASQRYPEFLLDLPVGLVIETVHDKYCARTFGQIAQCQRQRSFQFISFELIFLIWWAPAFKRVRISNRNDLASLSARLVDEQITGDPVEECTGVNERRKLRASGRAQEYVLHEIRCMLGPDPLCEIADKSGVLLPEYGIERADAVRNSSCRVVVPVR